MTNQSTIDKLIEMRLTAMADAFRIQMDDPAMKEVLNDNETARELLAFMMMYDVSRQDQKRQK